MNEAVKMILSQLGKVVTSCMGAVLAGLQPTFPFILVCTLAILADCYTAWALSRRVKEKYPNANDGKFKSRYAGRVVVTLIKAYVLVILAFLVELHIFEGMPLRLANITAGAICFWQLWSILENESSCSDAKWAKIAQRILVDKTERHFDIDLSELKEKKEQETNTTKDNGTT